MAHCLAHVYTNSTVYMNFSPSKHPLQVTPCHVTSCHVMSRHLTCVFGILPSSPTPSAPLPPLAEMAPATPPQSARPKGEQTSWPPARARGCKNLTPPFQLDQLEGSTSGGQSSLNISPPGVSGLDVNVFHD